MSENYTGIDYSTPDLNWYSVPRSTQLQKARREIEEGNKRFCKYCNCILSDNDIDEFTDLCIGCYIWRT